MIEQIKPEHYYIDSPRILWELMKINIKGYSISYSQKKKRCVKKKEVKIQEELNKIEDKLTAECSSSVQEKTQELNATKVKLETEMGEIFKNKLRKQHIRSKAR